MTDQVLKLVNRKNDLHRDWKSTYDNFEYERKKKQANDRIVNQSIKKAKVYTTVILSLSRKMI